VEFGEVVRLAHGNVTVPFRISAIRVLRIPPKIFQTIVGGDIVFVATLHPGRARSNKRFKDKLMDAMICRATVDTQVNTMPF
jgi:hypothetical protein